MDSHLTDTGVTVITTRGDLDLDGTRQLRQPLISATSAQQPLVVLDLAGLEFLDSSGISLLVHGVKRVRAAEAPWSWPLHRRKSPGFSRSPA
ncbi:STAS domain-containing protein [Catenulispora yoronensis]